jgi:phosphoenolpyruvate synthase/pyruvate phosphate dikinase
MPIIELANAGTQTLAKVGGKAKALGQLIGFGAPVPPGFVITPGDVLGDSILRSFDSLASPFVAVRSSAAGEDAQGQSWAGQFDSYLYVTRKDLLRRVADCRESGGSTRAQSYDPSQPSMAVAVVVQAMVASDVAGVLFTANPVTRDLGEIIIEAVYGLGELLVQGLATPDNFVVDRRAASVKSSSIATKTAMLVGSDRGIHEQPVPQAKQHEPALSPEQCAELAQLAVKLEGHFGHPLDIEWSYATGELFIVQARPITTL